MADFQFRQPEPASGPRLPRGHSTPTESEQAKEIRQTVTRARQKIETELLSAPVSDATELLLAWRLRGAAIAAWDRFNSGESSGAALIRALQIKKSVEPTRHSTDLVFVQTPPSLAGRPLPGDYTPGEVLIFARTGEMTARLDLRQFVRGDEKLPVLIPFEHNFDTRQFVLRASLPESGRALTSDSQNFYRALVMLGAVESGLSEVGAETILRLADRVHHSQLLEKGFDVTIADPLGRESFFPEIKMHYLLAEAIDLMRAEKDIRRDEKFKNGMASDHYALTLRYWKRLELKNDLRRSPIIKYTEDRGATIATTARVADKFTLSAPKLPPAASQVMPLLLSALGQSSGFFTQGGVPILGTAASEIGLYFECLEASKPLFPRRGLPRDVVRALTGKSAGTVVYRTEGQKLLQRIVAEQAPDQPVPQPTSSHLFVSDAHWLIFTMPRTGLLIAESDRPDNATYVGSPESLELFLSTSRQTLRSNFEEFRGKGLIAIVDHPQGSDWDAWLNLIKEYTGFSGTRKDLGV